MTNAQTLIEATEHFEAATKAVRLAELHHSSLVPGAPLRYKADAKRRLEAAEAELAAAQAAYDAAQDLAAPEE